MLTFNSDVLARVLLSYFYIHIRRTPFFAFKMSMEGMGTGGLVLFVGMKGQCLLWSWAEVSVSCGQVTSSVVDFIQENNRESV